MPWHQENCSGLWRSEDMIRVSIILQREVLRDTMYEVGMLGRVQFLDMNEGATAFARPFTEELRRCEELQRKLHFIEESMHKDANVLERYPEDVNMSATVAEMRSSLQRGQMHMIDDHIDSTVNELTAMLTSLEGLRYEMNQKQQMTLLDYKYRLLVETPPDITTSNSSLGHHSTAVSSQAFARLASLFGFVDSKLSEELYRLCYRITRGNAIIEISSEPTMFLNVQTGEHNVAKVSFVALCASPTMIARLKKLIIGLGADVYTLDEVKASSMELGSSTTPHHVEDTLEGVERRKRDVLTQWYEEHRLYKTYLKVEKVVLTAMNMCAMSGSTCTASAWVPLRHEQSLRRALQDAVVLANGSVESIVTLHPDQKHPPTFFETNRFTESFQGIVDSYGMARYKEVNPGVFTIITFPYLFGIMYGDIGHGVLLLLIALFFISKENAWRTAQLNEIVAMVFSGRYLLLLMSLFAIYMGVLYNDFFGFSLNLFSSGYTWPPMSEQKGTTYPTTPSGRPSVKPPHVYVMGLDVAWTETENKLEFYNSVKMKHAVIVGVAQMFAGLLLSLNNSIYQKNWYKIAFLFVPEFVFLLCTFGYMSILIIVKWCRTWESTSKAPSILEIMTNFFLQPGTVPNPLFSGQAGLQVFLLLTAFMMVPCMLLGMPYIEMRDYKRWKQRRQVAGSRRRQGGAQRASAVTIETFDYADDFLNEPSASLQYERMYDSGDAPAHRDVTSEDDAPNIFGDDRMSPFGGSAANRDSGAAGMAMERENERFENFDVSELMIHYVIHTIEYVLSSVSNTASYLRLWALSLAHAQLSEVFFNFTVIHTLNSDDNSGFVIAIGVLLWLSTTLGVLIGMEALSAFLHALRLHWVEFQNKFYAGDGRAFDPMDLARLNMHN
ncbi:vacuolar proton translocating ATPase subunit A, putative [Leishmania tarentolae]|uniref:V-type proton ATPase subunit a n=1 Tax=Leishmania tarentolae TaxID=5689 RepID=A0A640KQX3_LEITA|nr:vacuolar proton translocating ATPase subunit A, putative [Leishmania tarentolae]